jgi:hypothetical protein
VVAMGQKRATDGTFGPKLHRAAPVKQAKRADHGWSKKKGCRQSLWNWEHAELIEQRRSAYTVLSNYPLSLCPSCALTVLSHCTL